MSDVFYLRSIDPPITPEDVVLTAEAGGCFDLHRVNWKQSFLSADGGRMLCWYEAPDTESARVALRQLKANLEGVWPGTVTHRNGAAAPALSEANFVAELRLPDAQARSLESVATALEQEDAALVRGFVSLREPTAVCIVRAPSDGAVRAALARTDARADAVWACTPITPAVR
ncbi:MAG TPA: hypothetical protein VF339_09770 [Gammaproteobacteria bacterium]